MPARSSIYLDHHATTPVDPRVLETMLPYFTEHFGNPASRSHRYGWDAEAAVEGARETLARLLGAKSSKEVVFTSGATESNNLALKGAAEYAETKGRHIIVSAIEHKSVLDAAKRLRARGFEVSELGVDSTGRVSPDALAALLTPQTILVSLMLANNEVGTVQPIEAIGQLTHSRGILFHVDAVQGIGRVDFDVERCHVDLCSLSAHKLYGPKGVGALYVRRARPRVRLVSQLDGGGQEQGMRSGTLNVPGIMGFARAAELLLDEGADENRRVAGLRDRLQARLVAALPLVTVNGHPEHRLPGNLNLSFAGVEGEGLMLALSEFALSTGSACDSATLEPSYVLRAMGLDAGLAHSSLRFGLGRSTTEAQVDYAAERIIQEVQRKRAMSPLWEMLEEGIDPATISWSRAH